MRLRKYFLAKRKERRRRKRRERVTQQLLTESRKH